MNQPNPIQRPRAAAPPAGSRSHPPADEETLFTCPDRDAPGFTPSRR